MVVPLGLDELVESLCESKNSEQDARSAFAERILGTMQSRVKREARRFQLPACVDGIPGCRAPATASYPRWRSRQNR